MCSLFHLCRSRGWELYHEGKLEEAIAEWRVAADLDPEDGYILTGIGLALSKLGRQEEAFSEWWKAIHLEPEYDAPYIYLADALFGSGYTSKALATIRTALSRLPNDAILYNHLGYHLMKQAKEKNDTARLAEAGAAFQRVIVLVPGNSSASLNLAAIQWYTQQKREAIETLKASVAVNPNDAAAHIQLYKYQGGVRDIRGIWQTIDAMNKLPESEALNRHYTELNNLWAQVCLVFWAGLGFVGVMAGSWWYQRRG